MKVLFVRDELWTGQLKKLNLILSATHIPPGQLMDFVPGRKVQSMPDGHLGEFVWQIESRIGDLSRVRVFSQRELIKTGRG